MIKLTLVKVVLVKSYDSLLLAGFEIAYSN